MKSVLIHGFLAFLGLALAYDAWTREEEQERPAGEVTLAQCDRDAFESVELETRSHVITGVPKQGEGGTYYWVTSQRKAPEHEPEEKPKEEQAGKPDAGSAGKPSHAPDAGAEPGPSDTQVAADAGAAKPAREPEKPKEARPYDPQAPIAFLANEKFDELLDKLAPLRAMRSIGEVGEDKLEQFGFDDVQVRFRLDCGGKTSELEVGGRTYGSNARYVRREGESEAFLLEGSIVSDLQSAQYKFMQGQLHAFEMGEVDQAVVRAGDAERTLLHRNRKVPKEARWVDAAEPDRRNELFQTWFQRVGRLKAKVYLEPGEEAGSDLQIEASEPVPVMTIAYSLEGEPKGKLEMVRVDTDQGSFYYARTEATRFWVTMYDSLAKQVEEDVPEVVGEHAAEEPPPTSPAAVPAPAEQPAETPQDQGE